MRYVVGYPFYRASPEMCERVVAGLRQLDPKLAEVVFLLDGNDPDQREAIERAAISLDVGWTLRCTDHEIGDMACHNFFIDYMMETDAEAVIVFQDDIYLMDHNLIQTDNTMLSDLDRLLKQYGDRIGVVGLRHANDKSNSNCICALFDVDTQDGYLAHKVTALPVGTWAERLHVVPGPLVYPRSTVEKIGKLDTAYTDWWWWNDYCMRAYLAGLTTVVMSIDALHRKFGQTKRSHTESNVDACAADRKTLNDRYRHVFGEEIL